MIYLHDDVIARDVVRIKIGQAILLAFDSGCDSELSMGDFSVDWEAPDDEVAVNRTLSNITSPKLTLNLRHHTDSHLSFEDVTPEIRLISVSSGVISYSAFCHLPPKYYVYTQKNTD